MQGQPEDLRFVFWVIFFAGSAAGFIVGGVMEARRRDREKEADSLEQSRRRWEDQRELEEWRCRQKDELVGAHLAFDRFRWDEASDEKPPMDSDE